MAMLLWTIWETTLTDDNGTVLNYLAIFFKMKEYIYEPFFTDVIRTSRLGPESHRQA